MGPISHIPDTGNFPRLPQAPVSGKRAPASNKQHVEPAKQSFDEAYLSSCRPTRLSMEMMAKLREQGGK